MPNVSPIGREQELGRLVAAAEGAAAGHGRLVFVEGPTGSGKSLLLKALGEAVAELPEENRPDVVSVLCYETGAGNPLGPFGEVLRALTSRERRGDKAKRALELIGQIAPPLVELIPVIGKLAALGVKTAADVGVYALGGNREAQQFELAADVALALRQVATETPLVVIVDDAQWIDAASTEVVSRLADEPENHRLLLVVAYDPDLVTDSDLLARARSAITIRPGVEGLELPELPVAAVEALLIQRYGAAPDERLAAWLHDQTDGSPLFLTQFLALLEDQGVLRKGEGGWALDGTIAGEPGDWSVGGALAAAQTPDTLLDLLRPRVADLEDDERSLLEAGAVQGRRFLSSVLVRLLDTEEDALLDRLSQISERRRMIEAQDIEDWWSDRSAQYTFDPGVLQELLYGRYKSPYERRRRHKAVAEALEALVAEDKPPPRQALLEIAHHHEAAGKPVEAATRLVEVAESCFAEGADRDAATHAGRAVGILRAQVEKAAGEEKAAAQRLLARALLLMLLGGEPTWNADGAEGGGEGVRALALEAEQIADALGDLKLQANAGYATAIVQTAYGGLEEGLAAYRKALELARAAPDPLAEFAILMNYGHQLDSVSLEEGRKQLEEAHALLTGGALDAQLGEEQRAAQTASLETLLGVAAFDLGRYGEALELLERSAAALRGGRTSRRVRLGARIPGPAADRDRGLGGGRRLAPRGDRPPRRTCAARSASGRTCAPCSAASSWSGTRPGRLRRARPSPPPGRKRWPPAIAPRCRGRHDVGRAPARRGHGPIAGRGRRRSPRDRRPSAGREARSPPARCWRGSPSPATARPRPSSRARRPFPASPSMAAPSPPSAARRSSGRTPASCRQRAPDEAKTYAAQAAEVVAAKAESLTDAEQRKTFETKVRLTREILGGL